VQITPRDKRILQIAGVVVPLLLLVYFIVLRPDGGEDLALPGGPTGITGSTGAPTEPPSVTPSPTPRETLPPVSLAGSRDPFSIPPGLELSTGGSVSPIATASGTTTTLPTTTVPTTTTSTIPPPPPPATTIPPPPPPPTTTIPPPPPPTTTITPPPGGGGGGGEQPGNKILIGGHDVKLIGVAGRGRKLDVAVDGKVYTVQPGATFDDNFKLVRIDGKCATFLFGDQSFELCAT
jgi:hypothetical protein